MIGGMLALIAVQGQAELPEALVRAAQARDALQTAMMEYSIEWALDGSVQFFSWRGAGPDYLLQSRGDDEGVFRRGPDGRPLEPHLNRPDFTLTQAGQIWRRSDEALNVYVDEAPAVKSDNQRDLRWLGMSPSLTVTDPRQLADVLEQAQLGTPTFSTQRQGDLEVVTAEWSTGAMIWHIDPTRDWSVVRSEVYQDGAKLGEERIALRFSDEDGVWFPSRVERVGGDGQVRMVASILYTEFNRPHHPDSLSPADIGLETGMSITRLNPLQSLGIWDGKDIVSQDVFAERFWAGRVQLGPTVMRDAARTLAYDLRHASADQLRQTPSFAPANSQPPKPGASSAPQPGAMSVLGTAWERYTREFIEHYRLDAEQSDKAWTICRSAQESARPLLSRAERALARSATSAPAGSKPSDTEPMTEVLTKVDEHFATRLRDRLEKLLTRAQRNSSDGEPPTSPSAADLLR